MKSIFTLSCLAIVGLADNTFLSANEVTTSEKTLLGQSIPPGITIP